MALLFIHIFGNDWLGFDIVQSDRVHAWTPEEVNLGQTESIICRLVAPHGVAYMDIHTLGGVLWFFAWLYHFVNCWFVFQTEL